MQSDRRRCSTCYFGNQCPSLQICEDYISLTDEEPTEEERQQVYEEYVDAWLHYISEFNS